MIKTNVHTKKIMFKTTRIISSACKLHFNSIYKSNSEIVVKTIWQKKLAITYQGKTHKNVSNLE